ncbi:hypothetical protein F4692_002960 [Nocardioides cavernae]|uniref:GerMN domain-containing protein n=1 Tax=Nocardioides cavernae TaxID=1921566 RepID=A0A7Y9KTP7_9ACTN|nr:Gmad2 immunoglobulin-like domain-containing protein [Nocardioides cavernae]NYE37827.1 hypothetical protein [Nocardioides cavernae]
MTFPTRRPARRRTGAGALAVLAPLALVLALAGCAGDGKRPVSDEPGEPTSAGTPTAAEDPTPTGEPSDAATDEPTDAPPEESAGAAVPLYFAGDAPRGTALFREFQRVDGDPLTEAARIIAGNGSPQDPDYRTLWPQMEIASVQATDGVLVVDIPTDAFTERPDGMSKRAARLALQQLVYTLQGVQQERVPVVIERSETEPSLFGLSTETPFTAGSPMKTLNLVNITAPAEGDSTTRDVLTVSGNANTFEASGPCRLLQDGQELTTVAYSTEGWAEDRLFPFQVDIPLDGVTGEVVVQCETDDPSGGAEGNGPAIDTRTITVG